MNDFKNQINQLKKYGAVEFVHNNCIYDIYSHKDGFYCDVYPNEPDVKNEFDEFDDDKIIATEWCDGDECQAVTWMIDEYINIKEV